MTYWWFYFSFGLSFASGFSLSHEVHLRVLQFEKCLGLPFLDEFISGLVSGPWCFSLFLDQVFLDWLGFQTLVSSLFPLQLVEYLGILLAWAPSRSLYRSQGFFKLLVSLVPCWHHGERDSLLESLFYAHPCCGKKFVFPCLFIRRTFSSVLAVFLFALERILCPFHVAYV